MRARRIIVLLVLLVLCGGIAWSVYACFLMPGRHGGLRAGESDMDIMAGRHRERGYVLGVRVSDRVTETSLSKAYREAFGNPPDPAWRLSSAGRELWGGARETVQGSSAEYSGNVMARVIEEHFTSAAKKLVLARFFSLVQDPSKTGLAAEYADAILEFTINWTKAGKGRVDVRDLPEFREESR